MSVFEELNNFTGLVALYSALNSSSVYRLKACWEVFFLIFAENAFYRLRLLLFIFIFDVFLSLKFLYLDSLSSVWRELIAKSKYGMKNSRSFAIRTGKKWLNDWKASIRLASPFLVSLDKYYCTDSICTKNNSNEIYITMFKNLFCLQ